MSSEQASAEQAPLVDKTAVETLTGIERRLFMGWIERGAHRFPQPFLRHSRKIMFWRREDIELWLKRRSAS